MNETKPLSYGTPISAWGPDLPWEPVARYNALVAAEALDEVSAPHTSTPPGTPGGKTAMNDQMTSPNKIEAVILDDSPTTLPHKHTAARSPCNGGKDCPSHRAQSAAGERMSLTELPWDPLIRYSILCKHFKTPRGSKNEEHLEVLRQSDPCYGSLTPSKERPRAHELPYDPITRFNQLCRVGALKQSRGAKTTEHLEVLRQSNPCYGSLMPQQERPRIHELPYDPVRRFIALCRVGALKQSRGAKTTEHLEVLRHSNPLRPTAAYGRHSVRFMPLSDLKPYARATAFRLEGAVETSWRKHPLGSGSLPRILSNQALAADAYLDGSDDPLGEVSSHTSTSSASSGPTARRRPNPSSWRPPAPRISASYQDWKVRPRRLSGEERESSFDERDSLNSAARTSLGRNDSRDSTDSAFSFLEEIDDPYPSSPRLPAMPSPFARAAAKAKREKAGADKAGVDKAGADGLRLWRPAHEA